MRLGRLTLQELLDRLGREGLVDPRTAGEQCRAAGATRTAHAPLHWAIKAVMGGAGWFSAVFLCTALYNLLERHQSWLLAIGLATFAGAIHIRRRLSRREDEGSSAGGVALQQISLALGMGGHILAVAATGELVPSWDAAPSWTALALALVALAMYPDAIQQLVATIAAGVALQVALMIELDLPRATAVGLGVCAMSAVMIACYRPGGRHRRALEARAAIGIGATLVGLGGLLVTPLSEPMNLTLTTLFGGGIAVLLVRLRDRVEGGHRPPLDRVDPGAGPLGAAKRPRPRGDGRRKYDVQVVCAAALVLLCVVTRHTPGVVAALGVLLLGHYRRQFALSVIAVLFIIGFLVVHYYRLDTTLLDKAARLGVTGAALLTLATFLRWRMREKARGRRATTRRSSAPRWASLAAAGAALTLLTGVNLQIAAQERLISSGEPLYLELAPIDPRAPMMGDHMVLNYAIADEVRRRPSPHSGNLVITLDQRRIGRFVAVATGWKKPSAGQRWLRFSRGADGVRVAPRAFYFEEGQAKALARAKYAELRLSRDGRVALIALCDERLARIGRGAF